VQNTPSLLSGTEHTADMGSSRHFMLKEIHEQPETAALGMEQDRRLAVVDHDYVPRLLGITNRPESSLGRLVDQILDIGAGIEVGVAATKTFPGQLLAFYGLALAFAERHGGGANGHGPEQLRELAAALRLLPQQLRALVDDHDHRCEQLAHLFAYTQDVIFLGRGINFPMASRGRSSSRRSATSMRRATPPVR